MIADDLAVAMAFVPATRRERLGALFALDAALGDVVRRTSEPLIGRMRLAWWDERLKALDTGERLAQPVLAHLADHVCTAGISGAALGGLVDGWEVLLDPPPLGDEALRHYAAVRGGRLFAFGAQMLGGAVPESLGARWALVDLAANATPVLAMRARAIALTLEPSERAPKPLRVLARLASARLRRPLETMRAPLSRWEGLRATLG